MVKVKMFAKVEGGDEPALEMDVMDAAAFHEVVNTRRSVRIFAKDEVPFEVVQRCVAAAQKAPNSSNLQCWEVYRAASAEVRTELAKACLNQPAAATAPELFVFVARPDLWKRNNRWTL
ncbi:MAG: nitroreductase family protein, partial [Flavobacteriales bacterium]